MGTAIASDVVLPAEVAAFLRKHQAEASFARVADLVRDCYPRCQTMIAELRSDPDDASREKVILWVQLPTVMLREDLQRRYETYHDRLLKEVSSPQISLFGVLTRFNGD